MVGMQRPPTATRSQESQQRVNLLSGMTGAGSLHKKRRNQQQTKKEKNKRLKVCRVQDGVRRVPVAATDAGRRCGATEQDHDDGRHNGDDESGKGQENAKQRDASNAGAHDSTDGDR